MDLMINRVKMIIVEGVGFKGALEDLGLDEKLTDLGLNSINYIKILVTLENEFNMTFDEEDIDITNFNTINNVVKYMEKCK